MDVVLALAAPFPSNQGSQVYVRGMARALLARGHRVRLVAYGYGEGEPEPGLELVTVPVPPGYRRLRSGPDLTKPRLDLALARVLSRVGGQLVHAHNHEALAAALLSGRRPVVYNNHTLLGEELPTYFACGRALFRGLGCLADATLPRQADAVIAVTAAAGRALRERGCRDVTVVRPGLHARDFAGLVSRPEPRTLVYAGNADGYQGLDVLHAAMAELPGWRLRVVTGDAAGFPPGAEVIVTRSWTEARDLIARADVAVLPRSLSGGFPMKLLNYLACGVPTVVARGSAQGLRGEIVVADRDASAFAAGVRAAASFDRAGLSAHTLAACAWDERVHLIEHVYARVTGTTPWA